MRGRCAALAAAALATLAAADSISGTVDVVIDEEGWLMSQLRDHAPLEWAS